MTTIIFKSIYVTGIPHADIKVTYPSSAGATDILLGYTPVYSFSDPSLGAIAGQIDFSNCDYLQFINLPVLVSSGNLTVSAITPGLSPMVTLSLPSLNNAGDVTLTNLTGLTALNLPSLVSVGNFSILNIPFLTTFSLPTNAGCASLVINGSSHMTTINLPPSFYAACSSMIFFGLALPQAQVDAILLACVNGGLANGSLDMSGGSTAGPSGTGAANAAILIGNGWTVHTN